jgi:hypothetical protein
VNEEAFPADEYQPAEEDTDQRDYEQGHYEDYNAFNTFGSYNTGEDLTDKPLINFTAINSTKPTQQIPMDKRKCRKYKEIFLLRNSLFRYLADSHPTPTTTDTATDPHPNQANEVLTIYNCARETAEDKSQEAATVPAIAQFADSTVNPAIHTGTGFGFRGWYYITTYTYFNTGSTELSEIYLDSGSQLTIAGKDWILKRDPEADIRTRAAPIKAGGVGGAEIWSSQYIIGTFILPGTKEGQAVTARFRREVHLIDTTFSAGMIVGNDILATEEIDIITSKRVAYIDSYGISISIKVVSRDRAQIPGIVRTSERVLIEPGQTRTIQVHYILVKENGPKLFEPEVSSLSFFAHITEARPIQVLARNDSSHQIRLSKDTIIGHISDFDFDKVYRVMNNTAEIAELAVRAPPRLEQESLVTLLISEARHSSDATIYRTPEVVNQFRRLLDTFPISL